jgi:acyl carrier protein
MRFTEEEINDNIRKLIYELTFKKISSGNEPLVDSGILSSITVAELAIELERSFSISVSFMEINKENFNTLHAISELVKRKLN